VQRNLLALIALWACLIAPTAAFAQFEAAFGDAPFQITADTIDYERARDIYVARGNVRLVQQKQTMAADWVSFSRSGGRGVASGNVVFSDGVETVYANFVEFNIETLQGVMFLGRFDDSKQRFKMSGEEIVKTGDQTYTFEKGLFTTCRCPDEGRDPWDIRAETADLDFDSYATARNTTVNILGVPVLWLPWMAYPLSQERETGFLFPEFSFFGRDGVRLGIPFFWAAAPNVNVILTPRWFQKRGVKGDAEVQYLIGEESSGEIFASFISDDSIDPNSDNDPFDRERWIVRTEQDLHLPYDWRVKVDAVRVSDNRYPSDFRDLRNRRRDRYLESTVFATNQFGKSDQVGVVAAVRIADDIQSPDDDDRDPYLLQRMPELEVKVLPEPLPFAPMVVPSLDAHYTYHGQWNNPEDYFEHPLLVPSLVNDEFYDVGIDALPDGLEGGGILGNDHSDNAFEGGPEGDGQFQEGEPLADRGHRLRVAPRLAVPTRIGNHVEIYPEVGWQQSLYNTRKKGTTGWGAFTARADVKSRLTREFGTNVVHLLEPQLGVAVLAVPNIDDEPVFSPATAVPQNRVRQLSLDNVTRDPSDRPADFHGVTLGVGNRFYRTGKGDRPATMLADFTAGFVFDFAKDGRMGNFVIDGYGNPVPSTKVRLNLGLDPDGFILEELLADVEYQGEKLGVGLRYRYLERIPRFFEDFRSDNDRFDDFDDNFNRVNQVDLSIGYQFTRNWSARWQLAYSFENSLLLGNRASVEYLSKCNCWAAGLEVRQNRQFGFEFNILYRIVGLGQDPTGFAEGGLKDFGFLDGF
jgi:lipopolysaccharide assembly outer membrane protein LptD (OstA)